MTQSTAKNAITRATLIGVVPMEQEPVNIALVAAVHHKKRIEFNERNINMGAMVDRAAGIGEHPWWIGVKGEDRGQYTHLGDKPVTSQEILAASGQDWEVHKAPLSARIPILTDEGKKSNTLVAAKGKFGIVRMDTRQILGIVSERFEAVQNTASFSFFDKVIGPGQAVYEMAGSLGVGEKVWILARLPEETVINGVDVIKNYILLTNGHDGSFSFQIMFTPVRVVCQNTLNVATNYGKDRSGFRLSHFRGIGSRMNVSDAKRALGIATEEMAAFREQATVLGQAAITEEEIKGLCQRLFPLPLLSEGKEALERNDLLLLPEPKIEDIAPEFGAPRIQEKRDLVESLINKGAGNDHPAVAGTRWAAFNGMAEFTDYVDGWDSKRANNLLFGNGRDLKQRAWNLLSRAGVS